MIINLVLATVFLIIIGLCVLHGIIRNVGKARIRGISILVAAVFAVILTLLTKDFWVSDSLLDGVLAETGHQQLFGDLMENSPTLGVMLFECLASLIAPLLCLAYFFLLTFATWIIYLILTMVFGERLNAHTEKCKHARVRAGIWGGVWGIVICVMLMVPISGYIEIAAPVSSGIVQADILEEDAESFLQETVDEYIEPVDRGIATVYRVFGGGILVDSMTDFSIDDQDIDFSEEVGSVSSLACGIIQLTDDHVANYGSRETAAVNAVADAFEDSTLLPQIAGELVYSATDSWLDNRPFLGIEPPTAGSMANLFDPFLNTFFEILHQDAHDPVALQNDIRTVANMMNIFVEHHVFETLSNKDRLMTALSSDGIIPRLIGELGNNAGMKALIPEVTNLGVRAIAISLDIPNDREAVYEEFLASVANAVRYTKVLPEEQRPAALTEGLKKSFDEAGIPVDEEILLCYSLSMIEDLIETEHTHITADDIRAFFILYKDHSREEETVSVPDTPNTVELSTEDEPEPRAADVFENTVYQGMTAAQLKKTGAVALSKAYKELLLLEFETEENGSGKAASIVKEIYAELWENDEDKLKALEAFSLTQKLSVDTYRASLGLDDAKTLVTTKILMCDLIIDAKEAVALLEANGLDAEAAAISQIFVSANDVYKKLEYGSNIGLNHISTSLGSILDAFRLSACYGSLQTEELFVAIMQSEKVRTTANLDVQTATLMAQTVTEGEGATNYRATIDTLSKTVVIMQEYSKGDRNVSDAQLSELIKHTNRQNADMLEIYATPERVESYNVDSKYSEISSELFGKTFHSLAERPLTDAQYEQEAKSLNHLMSVAFSARSNAGAKYLFAKEGKPSMFAKSAEEMVDVFMASDALMSALRSSMLTEEGAIREDRFDSYDLGSKQPLDSTDRADCLAAMTAYYEQNSTEENKLNLYALSALLGIDETPFLDAEIAA